MKIFIYPEYLLWLYATGRIGPQLGAELTFKRGQIELPRRDAVVPSLSENSSHRASHRAADCLKPVFVPENLLKLHCASPYFMRVALAKIGVSETN